MVFGPSVRSLYFSCCLCQGKERERHLQPLPRGVHSRGLRVFSSSLFLYQCTDFSYQACRWPSPFDDVTPLAPVVWLCALGRDGKGPTMDRAPVGTGPLGRGDVGMDCGLLSIGFLLLPSAETPGVGESHVEFGHLCAEPGDRGQTV